MRTFNHLTQEWEDDGRPEPQVPALVAPAPKDPAQSQPQAQSAPGFAGMPGQLTPAERAYYYANMIDVTGRNADVARSQATAQALRGRYAPQQGRMDFGSQAARALSGVGDVLAERKASQDRKDMFDELKKIYSGAPGGGGGGLGTGDYWKDNWG